MGWGGWLLLGAGTPSQVAAADGSDTLKMRELLGSTPGGGVLQAGLPAPTLAGVRWSELGTLLWTGSAWCALGLRVSEGGDVVIGVGSVRCALQAGPVLLRGVVGAGDDDAGGAVGGGRGGSALLLVKSQGRALGSSTFGFLALGVEVPAHSHHTETLCREGKRDAIAPTKDDRLSTWWDSFWNLLRSSRVSRPHTHCATRMVLHVGLARPFSLNTNSMRLRTKGDSMHVPFLAVQDLWEQWRLLPMWPFSDFNDMLLLLNDWLHLWMSG